MNKERQNAFTMLELIMVILVLGILASLAIPRMEKDVHQEAADNILSALRFTQHMALMDNVIDNVSANRALWQRKFWRFGKEGCSDTGMFYYIASNKDMGGNIDVNRGEAAIDPANGKVMMGQNNKPCHNDLSEQIYTALEVEASPNIFLTQKYGIKENDAKLFGNCPSGTTTRSIGFDYLGRPHRGFENSINPDYSSLMVSDCNLTFEFEDGSDDLVITIEKETGRVYQVN